MSYGIDFSRNAPASKEKCIFIDECGYNLHLRKTIARSKKGSRAIVKVPTVRGRNVTVIAAMNSRRIIHYNIIDNNTCNSEKFGNFLRELVVILQEDRVYDDSWLIMDNAQIHKTELISGIVLGTTYKIKFLSPYSYMLNPIENAWSKMKSVAKNLLALPNNEDSLRNIIIESITSIEQQDCFNYIIHMMNNIYKAVAGEEFWS
jgi:transposase